MKKTLLILLSLVFLGGFAIAQGKSIKAGSKPATEVARKENPQEQSGSKLKSDGTPDKRFKENKAQKAAPAGPTKKDGTADKRYKANKDATASQKK